jgi:toxin ParE1/3/4
MNLRYTRRAFADREAIFDYLESENPQGALNVKRAIVQALHALTLFPRLGRPTDLVDVRELIVPRYPYKIYYRVDPEEIWVLHIRDARRRAWEGV